MKRREKDALAAYARTLADAMGLQAFQIEFDWKEPAADNLAESFVRWNSPTLRIRIAKAVIKDPKELRQTMIHELLHAYTEPAWATVSESFRKETGATVWNVFARSYRRTVERGVDQLAIALAPGFPLPDLKGKR